MQDNWLTSGWCWLGAVVEVFGRSRAGGRVPCRCMEGRKKGRSCRRGAGNGRLAVPVAGRRAGLPQSFQHARAMSFMVA